MPREIRSLLLVGTSDQVVLPSVLLLLVALQIISLEQVRLILLTIQISFFSQIINGIAKCDEAIVGWV